MTFDEQIRVKIIINQIETHQQLMKIESFKSLESQVQDDLLDRVKKDLKSIMKGQRFDE